MAEFKRQAPGEWKEAGDDPHAVMLKRLSHELAERKKLCELEKELEVRRDPPRLDPRRPRSPRRQPPETFKT